MIMIIGYVMIFFGWLGMYLVIKVLNHEIRCLENRVQMRDDRIDEMLAGLDKEYGEISVPIYLDSNNVGGITFNKPQIPKT